MAAESPPAELTAAYRAQLARLVLISLGGVSVMWANLFDPTAGATLGSLAAIGAGTATWVTNAQRAAADEAEAYLEAAYAATAGIPRAQVDPFARALELVGTAANGRPLAAMTGQAPAVYLNRLASGWSEADAAGSSLAWLNRLAGSEPMRVANATVMGNARTDARLTGRVIRNTAAGACPWCVLIADRGYIPSHAGFKAHANCRCTPGPELNVTRGWRDDINARIAAWQEGRNLMEYRAEYDALRQIGDRLDEEICRRLGWDPGSYDRANWSQRNAYHAEMFRVLGELRPMGPGGTVNGWLNVVGGPNGVGRLRDASVYYPSSWIDRSNGAMGPFTVAVGARRGYYDPSVGLIHLSDSSTVAVHELWHRMEDVVTGMRGFEYQFWHDRMQPGEEIKALAEFYPANGYGPNERAIQDLFSNAYMGKIYADSRYSSWEMGSMAMESLSSLGGYRLDGDYVRFMLSLLGAVG